jgi:signal transduction histidine kinase/FixJ family two-component response regulator
VTSIRSPKVRLALAALLPFAALLVQSAVWPAIAPFAWFLFFPAVFVGSWIGGLRAGLVSTALSTALVWLFFIPPRYELLKAEPGYYLSALLFVAMGVAFSVSHDRLRQANLEITRLYEKTREIDKLKTQLYARVSHELRTPLALVLGPTERWLGAPETSDEMRRDLEVIARNARTLLHHINDLLDVAKLEVRGMTADYADADVAGLVRFIAGLFEVLAEQNRIAFTVDVPASAIAQVDPDKLRRIVQNLLSNAFKFTPLGGKVHVSLREVSGQIVLEVADSGPGIPADRREVVFEPFRQLDEGSTRRFGGTGLGLAIVRELVALHRGVVSVTEAPEGGALFVVEIPREAPRGALVKPQASGLAADVLADVRQAVDELRRHAEVPPSGAAGGPVVLVIEDNPEMNQFVSQTLAATDSYRVLSARDGREGLALAIGEHPDIIVSDVMMPELSGDELVRAIRQRPELDAMPIVLLTAKADDELRVEMLRQGADDYLTKPFSVEELRARVGNLIARKRAEEHSRRLIEQIEDVADANKAVSEAISGLPASSVGAVLQTIALKAQTLVAAKYAAVGIGTDPELPFEPWVSVGFSGDLAAAIGRSPRPVGLLGLVANGDQPVRLPDLRLHPAYRGLPPHHPSMTSFLGVPIRYRGQTVGSLYLANKLGADEFTEHDQRIVEMLAARVGSAIETARLYRSEGMERAWLQAAVDQMPEGVVLLDARGQVASQNRAALALSTSDATPSVDLRLPGGPPIAPSENPGMRALALGEAVRDVELVARRSDGTRVPVMVSAAPVNGPEGTLAGATMVLRDITALKEIERLREEWAAIVAHDLQQPVNAILLGADLVLLGQLGTRERATVERMRASTARLGRMIHDLTEISALETQRLALDKTSIDLSAFVREVVGRCVDVAARVAIRVPAGPVMASCDPGRIEQVLSNLLSNAAKYGDEHAEIGLALDVDGAQARISVTNKGAGIPPDEIETLFDRYVRSSAARRSAIPGSGLGLYIAKGLVEAHGGRIWVTSVLGETTTFYVTIPLDTPAYAPWSEATPKSDSIGSPALLHS